MKRKIIKEKEIVDNRGERLRILREAKGVSIEEAAEKTKIHARILRAMENDAIDELAPPYAKGLLKIYCGFLGANPADFVEKYGKLEPTRNLDIASAESKPRSFFVRPRVNLSVIKKGIKLSLKPAIIVICILVLGVVGFSIGKKILSFRANQVIKPAVVKDAAQQPKPPALPTVTTSKPKLGIRPREDCWVEVKADGKTIFRDVLKKGYYEFWEANKRIEFSLGNAGGVDVEINGKLLPRLGRRGQVIKNIVVTKDGLTVPK